jgi:hypothetical protein
MGALMTLQSYHANVTDDYIEAPHEGIIDMPNLEHGAITMRLGRYLDAYVDEQA